MKAMETNSPSWLAEIIAFTALVGGLIGAWIKDRVGISNRLTKRETRQEILIDQHAETNRLLQECLLEMRRDKNPN